MKYSITIEETVSQAFDVECGEDEDPLDIAKEKYRSGEFVLEPGDVSAVQAMVKYPDGSVSEWKEL